MKRWQEERNYRIKRNQDGEIENYLISIDGKDVEVSKEVYMVYAQTDRRERYYEESRNTKQLRSLEQMMEDHVPEYVFSGSVQSSEDEAFALCEAEELNKLSQALMGAMSCLDTEDRELIDEIFSRQRSLGAIARSIGTSYQAVQQRRDRILRQLKNILKNS